MKILIVNNLYYPNVFGGAEMSARSLADALVAAGCDVVVASLNPRKRDEVGQVDGVRVHYLAAWNIYFFGPPRKRSAATQMLWNIVDTYNPMMAESLGRILDAERPDVVNTHNIAGFSGSVWLAVKRRKLPLVHTIRDHYLICPWGMSRGGKVCQMLCRACNCYSWPRRKLSDLVDVATGISHDALQRSVRYGCFPRAEKLVIYNACVVPQYSGVPSAKGSGALQFGFIGRLHRAKGVETLIKSFLGLPPGTARLLIAGRGTEQYEGRLRELIGGCEDIHMLGFVSPSDVLRQVDVLVVPSLWPEPAGRVVLEGMAYGIPVIGSCRGGISEQMGEGTGWIFDPDDPSSLAGAMQRAIDSQGQLEAMGERARHRALQFSTESTVSGYLQAYARAIESNGQNRKVD